MSKARRYHCTRHWQSFARPKLPTGSPEISSMLTLWPFKPPCLQTNGGNNSSPPNLTTSTNQLEGFYSIEGNLRQQYRVLELWCPIPLCAFYNPGHLKVKSAVSVQFLTIMLEFVEIQKLVLLSSKVSTAPPAVGAVTDATPNDDRKRAYIDQLMRMAGDFLWPVPTNGWSTLHLKDDAQPVAMRGLAQYQYRSCQK